MCLINEQNIEGKLNMAEMRWRGSKNGKLQTRFIANFLVYSWCGSAVAASSCVFGWALKFQTTWKIFLLGY